MGILSGYFGEWKPYLQRRRFRIEFILTFILLAGILFCLTRFLLFVEARPGIILPDPLLVLIDPVDLTWPIFSLIYVSLVLSIISFVRAPLKIISAVQIYTLMVIVRIICMYLVPLEPPTGHIQLRDPFVETFGTGNLLTKDLFFSGHTATLLILFLVSDKGIYKNILLIAIILVASFVIIQHVHYTIDVLAALFITYTCFLVIRNLHQRGILIKELERTEKVRDLQNK